MTLADIDIDAFGESARFGRGGELTNPVARFAGEEGDDTAIAGQGSSAIAAVINFQGLLNAIDIKHRAIFPIASGAALNADRAYLMATKDVTGICTFGCSRKA